MTLALTDHFAAICHPTHLIASEYLKQYFAGSFHSEAGD
jgi:hypothetical protein